MPSETILFAASAEESFEQLKVCIRGANSYGVIVPQAHFLEQFLRFYPDFSREHLYTPSSLLKACGLEPVPSAIASFSEDFDTFCDPSLRDFGENDFDAWLKRQPYAFWDSVAKEGRPLFERCIFFGSFLNRQRRKIINCLRSRCREFFILKRTFSRNTSAEVLSAVHVHRHPTVATGYTWIDHMKAKSVCGILLPFAKSLIALFRKPLPKHCSAWLDWQEEGTVGSFLAYAKTENDPETLQDRQRDCDRSFRECLTERFDALRDRLKQDGKVWVEPFIRCDLPFSASVSTYISLLREAKPPLELELLSLFRTCPLTITKRVFFPRLRRVLQYQSVFEADVLMWEEAVYLPVAVGFIPQAVSTNKMLDASILAWLTEIARRRGVLHLGVPLQGRNGEPLQPLLENFLETVSSEVTNADDLSAKSAVAIQTVPISAKAGTSDGLQAVKADASDSRMYRTMSNSHAMPVLSEVCEKPSKSVVLRFPNWEKNEKFPDTDVSVIPKTDVRSVSKTALRIPRELIDFSCKNWERFYLCPRKTWFERILRTASIPLHPFPSKALFLGEWIHDNLLFDQAPHDLIEWKTHIRQHSDDRWKHLCLYHPNVSLLRQRHQRALEISIEMAESCEEFLGDGWHIYSEQTLPPEAAYNGRIDLLAVHEVRQKIVVVDYKSGENETFTPKRATKGYGWQLLLYGQAVQAVYPSYGVDLRIVLRTGETKTLSLDALHEALFEMNAWIDSFRQTGAYKPLPEEKSETLPLAFGNWKF